MTKNKRACGCWESWITAPQTGERVVTDYEYCKEHVPPPDVHDVNRCLYPVGDEPCGVYTNGDYCREHAYRLIWDV